MNSTSPEFLPVDHARLFSVLVPSAPVSVKEIIVLILFIASGAALFVLALCQ